MNAVTSRWSSENYIELMRGIGFTEARVFGRTLKHPSRKLGLYLNESGGFPFFTGYMADRHVYDDDLWCEVIVTSGKESNPKYYNLLPYEGREEEAIGSLVR